jgi:hypothetical protein
MRREKRNACTFWWRKAKEINRLVNLSVDEGIIVNISYRNTMGNELNTFSS